MSQVHEPEHETLVEALRARSRGSAERLVYRFLREGGGVEQTRTFAELDRSARAIAAELAEHVQPGDRALLVYTPGLAYIESFWGCLYAGVVAVPAYPPEPERLARSLGRLKGVIEDADIAVVLTSRRLLAMAEHILADAPGLAQLDWVATDAIPGARARAWRPPPVSAQTLAMFQYTSGSTARPKGVMLSHGNLMHNLTYIRDVLSLDASTRLASWLPPYHTTWA